MDNKRIILFNTRDPLKTKGGRSEKLKTKIRLLKKNGWNFSFFGVEPNRKLKEIRAILSSLIILLNLKGKNEKKVIWSISSPWWMHIPALFVKIFSSNTLWIASLRDAIAEEDKSYDYNLRIIPKYLEKLVMKYSDRIITTKGSSGSQTYLKKEYPSFAKKTVELPYFGYKSEKAKTYKKNNFEKFTITYAGSFDKVLKNPISFFKGFKNFVISKNIPPLEIEVRIHSPKGKKRYIEKLRELQLTDYVSFHETLPPKKIFPILKGSNLLLSIQTNRKREDMIDSKYYPYVAAGRPIFVIADPDDDISELTNKHDLGLVAENDQSSICNTLKKAYFGDFEFEEKINLFKRKKHDRAFLKVVDDLWRDQ